MIVGSKIFFSMKSLVFCERPSPPAAVSCQSECRPRTGFHIITWICTKSVRRTSTIGPIFGYPDHGRNDIPDRQHRSAVCFGPPGSVIFVDQYSFLGNRVTGSFMPNCFSPWAGDSTLERSFIGDLKYGNSGVRFVYHWDRKQTKAGWETRTAAHFKP